LDILRRETAIQRAGALAELATLLDDLGVPREAVFDGSGLDPAILTPDSRVPLAAILDLLERAATVAGRPDLGLLLGLRFRMAIHGPIGELMTTAPTLGAALEDFVRWQPGYSSGAIVYAHPWGEEIAFGYALCAGPMSPSMQFYHCILGIALRIVEELTGGSVRPVEAHLCCRMPPKGRLLSRLVTVPIRYDQPRNCVLLPAEARHFPLPGHDPVRRAGIAARIAGLMEPFAPTTSALVRGALRKRLMFDRATMPFVAAELAMHPRTLRRHLADEDTTFERLRDEVRFAVACELLLLTSLDLGEIADVLAYASPGVFSDSFRRMQGTSPTEWRRKRQATD
jgi:AraC-like DNA-binding protein